MWIPFGQPAAVARVAGGREAPCLCGTVKFYQMGKQVMVVADICGLPESETGFFALHIHAGKACAGQNFADTAGHYDPCGKPHPMHAGDLPPLLCCDHKAFLAVLTGRFSVSEVLGRTVVIHKEADDFHSQPAGNAGQKIACGVICKC